MIVSDLAIRRSSTVIVLLVLIVAVGVYAYIHLPRESAPEVIVPFVNVVTTYQGVAPEDMESLVTVPIERKLTGISGIKEIRSASVEGVSSVTIEFEPDTRIDDALQKVRDKVDLVKRDLPQEADQPMISEINLSELPIMLVALTSDLGLPIMSKVAKDLKDQIEAIKGVLSVQTIGDIEREIQIEVDPDRVARYGVSLADLASLARLENVNTPGGALDLGEAKFLMRTPGEFTTPDELTGLVVKQGESGVVYLRDIATVKDGFEDLTSKSRLNGKPSIVLAVSKRAGENIIVIADKVKELVAEARAKLPPGMDLVVTTDQSTMIRDMVSELQNHILSGLVLVVAIIPLFMGLSNAFFVALAIPVSMLMTFAAVYMSGVTLNMVVLFSLILALGRLVDDGIVVVDNIYRHMQSGMDRVSAAKRGASEVAWPVTTSTITTVAAFVPLFFWPGIMGSFMFYLPLTVAFALFSSLFFALVVNPTFASLFMRARPQKGPDMHSEAHPLMKRYGAMLRLSLRWRAVTVTLYVTILVVIIAAFMSTAKVEFMPDTEPQRAYIDIKCPEGSNLETSDELCKQVEALVQPFKDNIEYVITNVGSMGVDLEGGGGGASSTHLSRVTLKFPKLDECRIMPSEIVREVREKLAGISGAEIRVGKEQNGPPTGPPVNIEISGDDYSQLAALASEVRKTIRDVPSLVDLRDDYDKGKPEVRVIVDRQQAWRMGLNVVVRFPKSFRENLANVASMNLISLNGGPVPFSAVAKLEEGTGLGAVHRINRNRTVTVSADVEGKSGAEVLNDVKKTLANLSLPSGYTVAFTGENKEQEDTQDFLGKAFFVALLLIALVVVTQFNSILQTLIIMACVALSLGGVFLGLWIHRMPFGILMTGIGVISLAGVVVNNAIVLIDFINQRRDAGGPITEAIVEASITRFRPVVLTAITTILGLIPMALGVSFDFQHGKWSVGGESAQWWGSLAISVAYGLAFATMLTLVVIPTLYSLTESLKESWGRNAAAGTIPSPEAVTK
ncbi:MAG: efflux RND transporter permease subunit [Candidatus Hydrogenedentes bacterium]|nr:efflux RND transporter permease subunit [Candidatus Hydrogenedentota bacterium]